MTQFGFGNLYAPSLVAPAGATVEAKLFALDGVTVLADLTLAPTASGADTYTGLVTLTPTPPDGPYPFTAAATTTRGVTTIYPAGSIYGWLVDGVWYAQSDAGAPGIGAYLGVSQARAVAATLPAAIVAALVAASDADLLAALQQATEDVDQSMRFQGRKYDAAQLLEFPRVAYESTARQRPQGIVTFVIPPAYTDVVWDWDAVNQAPIVPARVLTAVVHQANWILAGGDSRLDDIHLGLKSQANAGLMESYDAAAPGATTGLCRRAMVLMWRYRLSSGRLV